MQRDLLRLWRRIAYCPRHIHRDALVFRPRYALRNAVEGSERQVIWYSVVWQCIDCGQGWGLGHAMPQGVKSPRPGRSETRVAE